MQNIIRAGKIYLSFVPLKFCESIVITDGEVTAEGSFADLQEKLKPNAEVVDLSDFVVIPGFIDAHMHLDDLGRYLSILDLRGVASITELKNKLGEQNQGGEWVLGHGWDQDMFSEKRWPDRHDLDSVIDDRPVFLSRVDLHSAVINTNALEKLELEKIYRGSGDLRVTDNGEATGVITESVFAYVDDYIRNNLPREESRKMLKLALNECVESGVTTVGFVSCSLDQLSLLHELRAKGELPVRVRAYINSDELENFEAFDNDDFLKVTGIKIFSDGSLGSSTALLSFDYNDEPGNRGLERKSREEILELVQKAESRELDVATHAIGDQALDNVLWAYSHSREKHRIEHVAIVREDQVGRLTKENHFLVVQPHFIITDFWTTERIGKGKSHTAYSFNTLHESGGSLALSTDCPVEMLNPWETIYAAVTRGRNEDIPLGKLSQKECLSADTALQDYTKGSALALREKLLGSLTPGSRGDFIVIKEDPLDLSPKRLVEIKAEQTWINGMMLYRRSQ